MTAVVDDRKEVRGSEDFGKLVALLRGYLHGQPVLRVTVGAELVFHLGDPQPYKTARMKGHVRGTWQLRVMRSPWQVYPTGETEGVTITSRFAAPFSKPLSDEMVETHFERLFKGVKVDDVHVNETADLFVLFSNAYVLASLCKYALPDATKALWKLATPYKMAIHVFGDPAFCWSYLRSDVPRREG